MFPRLLIFILYLQNVLGKTKRAMSNNLKVVRSETNEFKIASDMRHLFFEFLKHQERLHKRLVLEERRIIAAKEQLT